MSESTYCLVFEGKITPGQDLAEVKKRLQKVFNKDAHTIEKLFSGKKVKLKQGLNEDQAIQFKAKMQSIGAVCVVESQAPKTPVSTSAATQSTFKSSEPKSTFTASEPSVANAKAELSASGVAAASLVGSPTVANVSHSLAPDSGKTLKLSDIDKAFNGTIPKVELPVTYKAGVIAMGVTMVLLPLLYIGLIAMIGYGVISHSIVNTTWLQTLGVKFGAIAYITPVIAGITVILFMIKPLFAKSAVKSQTVTLDPIKEPVLFHFVNKIALAVGAPRPKQIDVDCEVNASASFRKGLFSFVGDDLVLTIGMPLLAGFNAKQLAGVLAHEFGHFSQGVGMRFHYLAYKINSWFFYSVYARDTWDEKLDEIASEAKDWVSVILNVARGGVWLTRKLLYVFMVAGHGVSSYMLRQMEFDADRYEAQLAGSQQFKNTTLQLQRLGVAYQVSHDYLAQAWEDKKLVNNFPSLVAHNASQMPDELDRALLSQMEESRTQIYDSHPSDKQRIENAMRQQAKGIFSLDSHSSELFKRFDSLCKQVSQVYYAHELGLEFDPSKLVDINQVVKIAQDNEKQQEAYHVYFKDMAPVFDMPLSVNIFDTSKANWDDLLAQYKDIENQLADQIASRRMLVKKAEESNMRYQCFSAIRDLDQAGFILFPEWFDINAETLEAHKKHLAMYEHTLKESIEQLRPMFEVNDRRMSIALTLLNHPKILEADPDHAHHLKIRNRFSLLINNFKRNADSIVEFRLKHSRLAAFLSCVPAIGQKPTDLPTVRDQLLEDLKQCSQQLSAALNRLDYPFVAEGEHQTIDEYLEPFLPRANQFSNEYEFHIASGDLVLEKLDAIYGRIISGLAGVALTVDRLIPVIEGRMPMPEPVEQQVAVPVQVAEEIEQPVAEEEQRIEEQQVEFAKAVGTEDFTSNKKQVAPAVDKVVQESKPVQKPETRSGQVEEKIEQPSAVEPAAEKPKVVVKDNKDAGKRSSFAIDVPEPEAEVTQVEAIKAEDSVVADTDVEETVSTETKVVVRANNDAGKPASFVIDVPEPETQALKAEAIKADDSVVAESDAEETVPTETKVVVRANNDAGKPASFVIDEPEPATKSLSTETVKADASVAQETTAKETKVVARENNDAGKPASFTLDVSEPKAEVPKAEEANKDNMVADETKVVVRENNDAGKPASFVIDATEPKIETPKADEVKKDNTGTEEIKVVARENNDVGKPASFSIDVIEPKTQASKVEELKAAVMPREDKLAVEQQNLQGEPLAAKSSNPFMSRSAFSPKQEDDLPANTSPADVNPQQTVEQPVSVVAKAPNPFLANISSYQAKLAAEKSSSEASISMDALNAGSLPSSMSSETQAVDKPSAAEEPKPGTEKVDKISSFSKGGLSLEPLAGEEKKVDTQQDPAPNKPDATSVVVAKQELTNDARHAAQDEKESSQHYFKSPGLPNSSPAQERGLRPEPPADLFKAFGSDDDAEQGSVDADSEQDSSQTELKTNEIQSPKNRPSNH